MRSVADMYCRHRTSLQQVYRDSDRLGEMELKMSISGLASKIATSWTRLLQTYMTSPNFTIVHHGHKPCGGIYFELVEAAKQIPMTARASDAHWKL